MTLQPAAHRSSARPAPRGDRRYSDPVALWCPYCHQSFVGTVDRGSGRFVHGSCPVGRLDLEGIRRLAEHEWFWARFLERLGIALPAGARTAGSLRGTPEPAAPAAAGARRRRTAA